MPATIVWITPLERCQLCGGEFDNDMYDANINGHWGNVCFGCFLVEGGKLGTGLGQHYKLITNSEGMKYWLKCLDISSHV